MIKLYDIKTTVFMMVIQHKYMTAIQCRDMSVLQHRHLAIIKHRDTSEIQRSYMRVT